MITFSITIPADMDRLVRFVRDFFALIRKAYPEDLGIKDVEYTLGEGNDEQES